MKRKINIGIIGGGFMGKTHSYAIRNLSYFYKDLPFEPVLHTVCTSNLESANRAKDDLGFMYASNDCEEVIGNPDIDVIDICSPNSLHARQILMAIDANKHIYCEKPAVTKREEILEVYKGLKDSKSVNGIVFNNRYFPATLRARQLVQEGKLGNIVSFSASYLHASSLQGARHGWRSNKDLAGGGVLFDLGSHAIDLISYIIGNNKFIESVIGASYTLNPLGTDCEEHFNMIARFDLGKLGQISLSRITIGTNDELKVSIHGNKGALSFNLMEANYLYFYDGTLKDEPYGGDLGYKKIDCVGKYQAPGGFFPSPKAPLGWLQGHVHSMYTYLQAVYEGDKKLSKGARLIDSLSVNCIMDAAYKSCESGKEMRVEYEG